MSEVDKTLIQKTVYFYQSDLPKWEAVEKKTQWLHKQLNQLDTSKEKGVFGGPPTGPFSIPKLGSDEFKRTNAVSKSNQTHETFVPEPTIIKPNMKPKKEEPHVDFFKKGKK